MISTHQVISSSVESLLVFPQVQKWGDDTGAVLQERHASTLHLHSLPGHNTIMVSCHFRLSTCLETRAETVLLTGASPVSE